MKHIGIRKVKLKNLILPGDFKKRLKEESSLSMAESIRQHGCLYPPLMSTDLEILDGLTRTAAHFILDEHEMSTHMVEVEKWERDIIMRVPNLERRHDPEERARLIKELHAMYSDIANGTPTITGDDVQSGQTLFDMVEKGELEIVEARHGFPKRPEGIVLAQVAKDMKMSPGAVRASLRRKPKPKSESTLPDIETWGLTLPEAQVKELRKVQVNFDDAGHKLSYALGRLKDAKGFVPEGKLQRLRAAVEEACSFVRNARPECVCAYCKMDPEKQPNCGACFATGILPANAVKAIPPELRGVALSPLGASDASSDEELGGVVVDAEDPWGLT